MFLLNRFKFLRYFALISLVLVFCVAGSGCSRTSGYEGYIEYGEKYLEERDYFRAMKQFEAALKYKPNSAWAHYRMGQIYNAVNEPGLAVDAFCKAVELDPALCDAQMELVASFITAGKTDEAIELCRQTIISYPEYIHSYVRLARIYAVSGKSVQAGEVIERLERWRDEFAKDPGAERSMITSWIMLARGEIALSEFRRDEALALLEKSVTISGFTNVDAVIALCEHYFESGFFPAAEQTARRASTKVFANEEILFLLFEAMYRNQKSGLLSSQVATAMKKYPTFKTLRYFSGLLIADMKADYQAAVNEFVQVPDIRLRERYRVDLFLKMADCYEKMGRFDRAITSLRSIMDFSPASEDVHARIIELAFELCSEPEEALKAAVAAVRDFPDSPALQVLLARARIFNGQEKRGLAHLKKCIKQKDDVRYHEALMQVYFARGLLDQSLEEARGVLSLLPNDRLALIISALISISKKHFFQAKNFISLIDRHYTRDPVTVELTAGLYRAAGRPGRAFAVLKAGMEKYPGDSNIMLQLVDFFLDSSDLESAFATCRELIKKYPDNVYARTALLEMQLKTGQVKNVEADIKKIPDTMLGNDNLVLWRLLYRLAQDEWTSLYSILSAYYSSGETALRSMRIARFYMDSKEFLSSPLLFRARQGLYYDFIPMALFAALCDQHKGKPGRAEKIIARLLDEGSINAALAGRMRINTLISQGDFETAMVFIHQSGFDVNERGAFLKLCNTLSESWHLVTDRRVPLRFNIALLFDHAGWHEKAVSIYMQLLRDMPDQVIFLYDAVSVLLDKGELERAIELTDSFVKSNPNSISARYLLCRLLIQAGNARQAISYVNEVMSIGGNQAGSYLLLAQIHARSKDWEAAAKCYREAMRLDREDFTPYIGLALALLESGGSINSAWENASKAFEMFPDNPVVMDICGRILWEQEKYNESLWYFEKAENIAGGDLQIKKHLAQNYAQLGINEKALETYENLRMLIAEDSPDYDVVMKAIEKLLLGQKKQVDTEPVPTKS